MMIGLSSGRTLALCAGAATAILTGGVAAEAEPRNFDARPGHHRGLELAPSEVQRSAVEAFRGLSPGLAVTYDTTTGVTRTLGNRTGYLTPENRAMGPEAIALAFVHDHVELLGLDPADLDGFEITDSVYSAVSGATRFYLRQTYLGLPVYNGQLQINVNRAGRVLSVSNAFVPGLTASAGTDRPTLSAPTAVSRVARHLELDVQEPPRVLEQVADARNTTHLTNTGISLEPLTAQLMWLPIRRGETRLVWNFQIRTLDSQHWYNITVDAATGEVWTRSDWVNSDSYRVYAQPLEHPDEGERITVVDPADPFASPLGWHDNNNMDGNNVHAYDDLDDNNSPPGSQPSCGASRVCDFPINLGQDPFNYTSAAIANLFYWNNTIHDIQWHYGFDEMAGNFQEMNFGRGGAGSDSVNAEAQDGRSTCNANFATPADGGNPRMQMFVCEHPADPELPMRDGDLDNEVIVHEYGHGISIRQVGGPSNSSCLNNFQQMGEGWSDWFALVYTATVGDAGTDVRGFGTYLFGLPPGGSGIRPEPYSTDPQVNGYTFASIDGLPIPHGVGSVWAQVLWEAYWALVDEHGFAASLQNFDIGTAEAGNRRALFYVNEGLKNTTCSPTFADARDGVIQAAVDNFGGVDVCLLWEVFAAFGLGVDAEPNSPFTTRVYDGFELPPECRCQPEPIADAGPDRLILPKASTMLGTPAQPDQTYSWSPGDAASARIDVTTDVGTTFQVTATTVCGSATDSATVFIAEEDPLGLDEDFGDGAGGWTVDGGLWHVTVDSLCVSPLNGPKPRGTAYYGLETPGLETPCNYETGSDTSGTLTSPPILGVTSDSTLRFDFFRQVEHIDGSFDRTEVQILVDGEVKATVFALDSRTRSQAKWTSAGPISLAAFGGQVIQVGFFFDSVDDQDNDSIGWMIDNVRIDGTSPSLPGNSPPVVNDDFAATFSSTPVTLEVLANDFDFDKNLDPATLTIISPPPNSPDSTTKKVSIGADLFVTYTPDFGFDGSESFTYEVCDSEMSCDSATAEIRVIQDDRACGVDDPCAGLTIIPSVNNTSAEVDDWSSAIFDQLPAHGCVLSNGDGTFTYRPGVTYQGRDSFSYEVPSVSGAGISGTVTIEVPLTDPATGLKAPTDHVIVVAAVLHPDLDASNAAFSQFLTGPQAGEASLCRSSASYRAGPPFDGRDFLEMELCDPAICASARVPITIDCEPANASPCANITSPTDGTTEPLGTFLTFVGDAFDPEDGNLTANLIWSSSLDGVFGIGGTVVVSTLSAGCHVITASVVDSGGLLGSDSISIIITDPINTPSCVNVVAPVNGARFLAREAIAFIGTATDVEDGDLTASMSWESSRDGALGMGGSLTVSTLSADRHTVTASILDSGDLPRSDAIIVSVTDPADGPRVLYGAAHLGLGSASTLYVIDPASGAATAIGEIGHDEISGMALAPDGRMLATGERSGSTAGHVLLTLDLRDGTGTEIGPTGVEGFQGPFPGSSTMTDISFCPGGELLAYSFPNNGLATVDTSNGAATQVSDPSSFGSLFFNGNGLACSAGGVLYHGGDSEFGSGAGSQALEKMDPVNSDVLRQTTLVFPVGFGLDPRPKAMDFFPGTHRLYAVLSPDFDGPTAFLGTIDIATGVVDVIGPTVAGMDALAWGPPDRDRDRVADATDRCPSSDLGPTVVIESCDSGVANTFFEESACTISDLIASCRDDQNRLEMVCVTDLVQELKKDGFIGGNDSGDILQCAAASLGP